jgi:raffinose/stachyose/melibiose transport system permease protein
VQILVHIMLPLIRPAIASVLIFNGVGMWNDFLFPYIVSTKLPTIQVGILQLHGSYGTAWGLIFAGVMIAALPIIVLYALLTKQFISGLAAGAIKG